MGEKGPNDKEMQPLLNGDVSLKSDEDELTGLG